MRCAVRPGAGMMAPAKTRSFSTDDFVSLLKQIKLPEPFLSPHNKAVVNRSEQVLSISCVVLPFKEIELSSRAALKSVTTSLPSD